MVLSVKYSKMWRRCESTIPICSTALKRMHFFFLMGSLNEGAIQIPAHSLTRMGFCKNIVRQKNTLLELSHLPKNWLVFSRSLRALTANTRTFMRYRYSCIPKIRKTNQRRNDAGKMTDF